MSGRITTHVLDLAGGKPVIGIAIELWYLGETAANADGLPAPKLIGAYKTNNDGRVDHPLLEGDDIKPGIYELIFAAGEFFRRSAHLAAIEGSIFEWIPIRFHINDANSHYHVPLLVAPGGYSTYRGS
ncbi:hydroxyisourate hydrolase [Bacillus sp. FJAT-26390]|uniref:hydroxyisourate hydrolase n=1 Tax=Bacillus sp. FJAT-26390 TaxID=1743142 RepID=UPI000807BE7E|nr:hydroxyisourate hydrolase [Bacillus sp. FJAT-26390]OBZ17036.1 hydroxyisourate hydrolase [Bacillus sp. FJAT-26390]